MALLNDTAHRIDREPVLFLGCSGAEIMTMAGLGAFMGLLIGLLLGLLTGLWFLTVPCLFLSAFIGVWRGGLIMKEKKEGKPDGYYGKVILSYLSDQGILNLYIKRTGPWSIRR
jgi:conjugative transfer region protein (TIGR03750 family)